TDLKRRIRDMQAEADRVETKNLSRYPFRLEGKYRPRPYPWMSTRHRRRDEHVLAKLEDEFLTQARQWGRTGSDCTVQRHAFGRVDADGDASRDILGIFAARDLKGKTTLVEEGSRTWGCTGPGTDGSTANLGGGLGCPVRSHPDLPSSNAADDLRW
ncbi:hypothetical protein LTR53_019054, partial [Teratosphaeriaceae sp. CCFEE 6253]